MSLDTFTVVRPNQRNGGSDVLELAIEQFTGAVEGTIDRRSKLKPLIPMRTVKGTSTVRDDGIGESTLQKITPGTTPNGTAHEFGKNILTIDTTILARETLPVLDVFQTSYDKRIEIGREHGKKIAKFLDQALFIQAAKAAASANSAFYNNSNELNGHSGGSTETLAVAGDQLDPAKLYAALARLLVKMELKDVVPQDDDLIIAVKPGELYSLAQAEQVINGEYITADGNTIKGMMLKAYGVPVMSSNNYVGGQTIASHLLGTSFDGDFTKLVATAFSPRAILAGETIPLTTEVFWDSVSKSWFVDAYLAFSATKGRTEFAGSIVQP